MLFITFFSCKNEAKEETKISENTVQTDIQLIQFHTEHRCVTCNNIEKLSKETIKGNEAISFVLYNVDDEKNAKVAEQFEASGTSLYLYNSKTKATIERPDVPLPSGFHSLNTNTPESGWVFYP